VFTQCDTGDLTPIIHGNIHSDTLVFVTDFSVQRVLTSFNTKPCNTPPHVANNNTSHYEGTLFNGDFARGYASHGLGAASLAARDSADQQSRCFEVLRLSDALKVDTGNRRNLSFLIVIKFLLSPLHLRVPPDERVSPTSNQPGWEFSTQFL